MEESPLRQFLGEVQVVVSKGTTIDPDTDRIGEASASSVGDTRGEANESRLCFLVRSDVGAIRFRRCGPGTGSSTTVRRSRRGTSSQRYSRKKVASSWNVVRSLRAAAQSHLGRRSVEWRGGKGTK